MNTGFQQTDCNFRVRFSWHGEADGVDAADRPAPVGGPFDLFFVADLSCGLLVKVANECKLSQAFRGEIRVNARVLPAQMAHADDCGA